MEVRTLTLTNESKMPRDIIINPFHSVHEFNPEDTVKIMFFNVKHIHDQVFNFKIRDHEIVVELEFDDHDYPNERKFILYINNEVVDTFQW